MTHLQAACRRLPDAPIVDGMPTKHFSVDLLTDSARMLARGVRMIGYQLKKEKFRAYAHLTAPQQCESHYYGPVLHLKQWSIAPGDGLPPRWIYRLVVGLIE